MNEVFEKYEVVKKTFFIKNDGVDEKRVAYYVKKNGIPIKTDIEYQEPVVIFGTVFFFFSIMSLLCGEIGLGLSLLGVTSFFGAITYIPILTRGTLDFTYQASADAHIQNLLKIKEGKYEKENFVNKGDITVSEIRVIKD